MSHFTVKAEDLSAALNLVLSSVETKTTIPILGFLLFESNGQSIKVTATDMDTYTSLNVQTDKADKFSFCAPAKQLRDLVSLMDGDVKISTDSGLAVQCGLAVYNLASRDAGDFPQIERAEKSNGVISGDLLSRMIRAASIAASTNPHDTEVSKSILISASNGKLDVVGCDQKRLASATVEIDAEFYAVMPLESALGLAGFAARSETVEMFCAESLFTIKSENGDAGSRLLATKWPDWKMIIPKTSTHKIEVSPAILTPVIKRAILTTDGVLGGLKFTLGKKTAVVTTRAPDQGNGQESFPVDCPSLNGEGFVIGIPGRQVLDLFKICKGKVDWELDSPSKQVSFKPQESLGFDFQYIVMPIRVDAL